MEFLGKRTQNIYYNLLPMRKIKLEQVTSLKSHKLGRMILESSSLAFQLNIVSSIEDASKPQLNIFISQSPDPTKCYQQLAFGLSRYFCDVKFPKIIHFYI